MRRLALAAGLAAATATGAAARAADPEDYALLIGRYVDACQALSAQECTFSRPLSAEDAGRLACLFDQLDIRGGPGTAGRHVAWAETYAATGETPASGFPASIGDQQILMASLLACRDAGGTEQ